jgi:hypothetical protein
MYSPSDAPRDPMLSTSPHPAVSSAIDTTNGVNGLSRPSATIGAIAAIPKRTETATSAPVPPPVTEMNSRKRGRTISQRASAVTTTIAMATTTGRNKRERISTLSHPASRAPIGSSALLWLRRVQLHVAGAGLRCDRN